MVVCTVRRFSSGIHALTILTKSHTPPIRPVSTNEITTYFYGFVDASESGYGISLQLNQNHGSNLECLMRIQAGLWGSDMSKSPSNHREFSNLVKSVETAVRNGQLTNAKTLFAENHVPERAYYRGTSKIEILFQLVLRLQKIEMEGTLRIQVINVAGTCMIAQGNGGFSRGLMM